MAVAGAGAGAGVVLAVVLVLGVEASCMYWIRSAAREPRDCQRMGFSCLTRCSTLNLDPTQNPTIVNPKPYKP